MGISGFFGKANISRLDVAVTLPEEVYADTPFPLKITLRNNRALMPAFLVRVTVGGENILFPFVDKRSEAARHIQVSFRERGSHTVGIVYASSVFPFNFFTRFTRPFRETQLLVFPKLRKGDLHVAREGEKRLPGEVSSLRMGYESEMVYIRDYVLGDPLKYINWKATAKTGSLKTKELSAPHATPVVIDFDKIEAGDVEERISRVSYALVRFLRENVPVGLKIRGLLFEPSLSQPHKTAMLRELALYPSHAPFPRVMPEGR